MINLKCGNCIDLLGGVEDNSIDLVIIDPPYEFYKNGGGGAFGTKKRKYHKQYLDLYHETGNESDRINANAVKKKEELNKLSYGFDMKILDVLVNKMKKINIYIWCSKGQVSKILDYFEEKDCATDILTWHKTNPIPTCNNTYLSDTEYLIFAREKRCKNIWKLSY